MNDYEFAKLIRKAIELHEEKTKNNKYILTEHMKEVFELADIFTIDALDDGMVSIELRILEAGILISEN